MSTLKTQNPGTMTDEAFNDMTDEAFGNALTYKLYQDYLDELANTTEAELTTEQEELQRFATLEGVSIASPFVSHFAGFRAGIVKGLELAELMEKGRDSLSANPN